MPTIFLKDAWSFALNQFNNINSTKASQIYDELIELYSKPHRIYHTITHIENMINSIYELLHIYSFNNHNIIKAELILAAFFHDAIYDPLAHNLLIPINQDSDETLSANIATKSLKFIGIENTRSITRIHSLIILTKEHTINPKLQIEPLIQEIFIDSDISILGSNKPKYNQYKTGIWNEYNHIEIESFITGRLEFLTHYIEKKAIFKTEYMNQMYNEQAYVNINNEILELKHISTDELIKSIEG